MKISEVFIDSSYRQVLSEEGNYDAHVGFHLVAKVVNEAEKFSEYFSHFHTFRTEAEAEKFLERVESVGRIDDKKSSGNYNWNFIKRDYHCEIPYWATPEFAHRERNGTL